MPRLSGLARAAVAAVVLLLVLAAGAIVGSIRYGAGAVEPGGGFVQSIRATGAPVRVGIELRNTSAVPVTLTGFVPHGLENLRVLDARVVRIDGRSGISMLTEPLDATLQPAVDASVPVDGFVLPPHRDGGREYEVVVRVQRITAGRQAVLRGGAITYSALGFAQGAVTDGVSCIRAPARDGCPGT